MSNDNRTERSREQALDELKAKILLWYLENGGDLEKVVQCEDKRAHGKILWHLEPPIEGLTNPQIIVEYLGDMWTVSMEPLPQ